MTATLFAANVTRAADQIAAADHIPVEYAHDIVSVTAPLVCATNLRRIAALAHDTLITTAGTHRVVRVDDLLATARLLEEQSANSIRELVAEASDRTEHEALEIDRLRAEKAALLAGREAMLDELVRRRLVQCGSIGEHPLTVDQQVVVEAECRAFWLNLGGVR